MIQGERRDGEILVAVDSALLGLACVAVGLKWLAAGSVVELW